MKIRPTAPLFAATLLASSCGGAGDPQEVRAHEVQEDLEDALRTLRGYTHDRSDELIRQVDRRLDNLGQRIEELRTMAGAAAAEERRELDATLQELEAKRERLKKRLVELGKASENAWSELRDGALSALEELDGSLDQAYRSFQAKDSR